MILNEEQFKFERVKAWQQEIQPSIDAMDRLSRHWVSPQNVERLDEMKSLLIELSVAQNQIEKLANKVESTPARKALIEELSPFGDTIANQITTMIDIESQLETNEERKKLFKMMADFRGSFGLSLAALRLYVLTDSNRDNGDYQLHWTTNTKAFHNLLNNRALMSDEQQIIFAQLQRVWQQYNSSSIKVTTIMQNETHNIANKMLAEEAEPKAQAVLNLVKQLNADQTMRLEEDFQVHHGEIEELIQFISLSIGLGILFVIMLGVGISRSLNEINKTEEQRKATIAATQTELKSVNKDLLLQIEFSQQMELISSSIQSHKTLDELCDGLISTLATFVNGCFGAIYLNQRDVLSQDEGGSDSLLCYGRYAIAKGQMTKPIDFGEGLIGQCAAGQKMLNFSQIPKNYLNAKSGLGESKDYHLLLVPILFEEHTLGVIELASFAPFEYKQQQSIQNIAPNIAIGINNQVYIDQVQSLLKHTQEQSELMVEKSRNLEEKNLEIERSQQLLAQRAEDLERSNRYKSDFLATMSHEIRTPMNGVIGMLGLLEESKLNKNQMKKVMMAQSSASSLLSIINDILDFSKIDAGKLELEIRSFNLFDFLEEVCDSFALKAREKNLELIVDTIGIKHPFVKGDAVRIRQILTNLVANAIKFTSQGRVLITISTELDNDKVTVKSSVDDTGIGVDEDKRSVLFEPFRQADASTTRNFGGTGLGLSIVKKLVNQMNGQICFADKESAGSLFVFDVQLEHDQGTGNTLQVPNLDGSNVLLIGQDNCTRKIFANQLKQWQAHVIEKSVTQLLTENINDNQRLFDLIVIDQSDTESGDIDIATLIRDIPEYNDVKLVALTDVNMSQDQYLPIEEMFDCLISKPIYRSNFITLSNLLTQSYVDVITKEPLKVEQEVSWPADCRVLLVEDNIINQEVVKAILADCQLPTDVAINGEQALEKLQESQSDKPFSIVLMDCQMPVMDGMTATKEIRAGRASDIYTDIPIIALTANAMAGDKEACLAAGMSDYLAKPIEPKGLKTMLAKWLTSLSSVHC